MTGTGIQETFPGSVPPFPVRIFLARIRARPPVAQSPVIFAVGATVSYQGRGFVVR